jgi:hypothetical protein
MNEKPITGRERTFALLEGGQVDHVPFMPITMQFACDLIGKKYYDYVMDHRILVEGQLNSISTMFHVYPIPPVRRQIAGPQLFMQKILRRP